MRVRTAWITRRRRSVGVRCSVGNRVDGSCCVLTLTGNGGCATSTGEYSLCAAMART